MPIILTGDVHQAINSEDQGYVEQTESALAVTYAQIAARHNLPVTLFFTARAVLDHTEDAFPLVNMSNVEIGGHGWDAIQPVCWHGALNRLTGSPHGPKWMQARMIRQTCGVLEVFAGKPIASWRNHAYRHDLNTPSLLVAQGIHVWSDEVNPKLNGPYKHPDGVTILPLNTLPDHENMLHGGRTVERLAARGEKSSITADAWCDLVCTQTAEILTQGGTATILAHPICMKLAGDWTVFERLCTFLSNFPADFARDTAIL